ncbi:hypothetical protein M7I_0060 [Glarea lozoyensis 74030]|uniref:Uncharacterized protein n=1 Tax=Glarea lozoyensis (strain ATCC 74030 / MF5533) TaxID=1104152 RepID=H0ECC6_GLAL7|nr:hypothetical protein M7I_0060 [Glarea lozoyensis 74030]
MPNSYHLNKTKCLVHEVRKPDREEARYNLWLQDICDSAVLYLLIVVGCTSAEGRLKSQYLEKVFGGGKDIQRK